MLDPRPIRVPISGETPEWPDKPVLRGKWRELEAPLVAAVTAGASRLNNSHAPMPSPVDRMRALPMPFYPRWTLVEALARYSEAADGVFHFLIGPRGYIILNGTSPQIYALNAEILDLKPGPDTDLYLSFFTNFVRGPLGPFRIVERMFDVEVSRDAGAEALDKINNAIKLMRRGKSDAQGERRTAAVVYGGALFRAGFSVPRNGQVKMLSDKVVIEGALAPGPSMDGIWTIYPDARSNPYKLL